MILVTTCAKKMYLHVKLRFFLSRTFVNPYNIRKILCHSATEVNAIIFSIFEAYQSKHIRTWWLFKRCQNLPHSGCFLSADSGVSNDYCLDAQVWSLDRNLDF